MLRIAVCDDENVQQELIASYVHDWAKRYDQVVEVTCFESALAFSFAWEDSLAKRREPFDVLLLDIQMEGQNGVELAHRLRKRDNRIQIVFITGLAEYMDEGYEVDALHYLVKPLRRNKLYRVLLRALERIQKPQHSILVESHAGMIRIPEGHIRIVEATQHKISVETAEGIFILKKSIAAIQKELSAEQFCRCHRSYIVNLAFVCQIHRNEAIMDGGRKIPISQSYCSEFNQAFIRYYTGGEGKE